LEREAVIDYGVIREMNRYTESLHNALYFKANFLKKVGQECKLPHSTLSKLSIFLPRIMITYAYRKNDKELIKGLGILKRLKNANFQWVDTEEIPEISEASVKELLFRLREQKSRILISADKYTQEIASLRDIRTAKIHK
jgi:hypothetical protein